jgi:nitrite reductase/ring-hydroxylating ferredoxin subunit
MGFFARLFGITRTKAPADAGCWNHVNGAVEIDLARAPELAAPGGAIHLAGNGLPHGLFIMHGSDGALHAFDDVCPHGKRKLDPFRDGGQVRCCSVGKSTFTLDGALVSGPAGGPISTHMVQRDGGRATIKI